MSSFYAYAGIGVKVDKSKLYKEVGTPGCKCWQRSESDKFCPMCGSPVIVGKDVPIDGYDPSNDRIDNLNVAKFSYCDDAYITVFMLGVRTQGTDSEVTMPPSLDWAKAHMKEKLEPLGLWDESKFGLWCIGHISC